MERLGSMNHKVSWAVFAALLMLLFPAGAGAKVPAEAAAAEAPAGITIRGIGFAANSTDAANRAVRDARERARLIARVLGLEPGRVESVDLPDLTQFGGVTRRCGARRDRAGGCPVAAVASVTFAIAAGTTGEAGSRTVGASGAALAAVEPRNRDLSRSIKRAVLAARRAATPEAATAASRSARSAARAAGLQLGPIVSVAEAPPPLYYGPSFYDSALGSFGPGRFCGIINRPVVRRDPETGVPRVVRRVPRRRCIVTAHYSVHLEIRYEAK